MNDPKTALLEAQEAYLAAQLAMHEAQAKLHRALTLLTSPTVDEEPLTVEEVARRLNLSTDRTREKLANGEIRAKKVGRRWLVMPSDLQAYLRGGAG